MQQFRTDEYALPVAETSALFTAPLRAGDMAQIKPEVEAGKLPLL